jgi:type VI secretion system protein ImpA
MILDYYQEFEPSSPIPILINRSKKLVHSDFLDIVKDIFPEALEQIKTLGGFTEEAQQESESESSGSSW